mmetsp:Transcript_23799/g.45261  ORF Transcript_23799/g.45261 Transcript_23799/m.45261 type:complete len:376 (-) Transcript_23799:2193-3320(-)
MKSRQTCKSQRNLHMNLLPIWIPILLEMCSSLWVEPETLTRTMCKVWVVVSLLLMGKSRSAAVRVRPSAALVARSVAGVVVVEVVVVLGLAARRRETVGAAAEARVGGVHAVQGVAMQILLIEAAALLGVGEHVHAAANHLEESLRLRHQLLALLVVRARHRRRNLVRVVTERQLAVRLLDLPRGGCLGHAQEAVVVHRSRRRASTRATLLHRRRRARALQPGPHLPLPLQALAEGPRLRAPVAQLGEQRQHPLQVLRRGLEVAHLQVQLGAPGERLVVGRAQHHGARAVGQGVGVAEQRVQGGGAVAVAHGVEGARQAGPARLRRLRVRAHRRLVQAVLEGVIARQLVRELQANHCLHRLFLGLEGILREQARV